MTLTATSLLVLACAIASAPAGADDEGQTDAVPGDVAAVPAANAAPVPEAKRRALDEQTRVLLMTPQTQEGIDPGDQRLLDLALAEAIGAQPGVTVVAQSELKTALDLSAARQQLGCDDDDACLAALSADLDVDLVVNSKLGAVGRQLTLSLSVLDARGMSVRGRASRTGADVGVLLDGVPDQLAEAMGWERSETVSTMDVEALRGKSFAVFPLGATGVDEDTVRNLTELVATELKRVEGVSVLGMSDVEALLEMESDRASLGCTDDNSCLAELGGALGVDKIVTGEIGRVGERRLVGLRMIDREAVTVDNRVTEAFQGPDEQLVFATRHAVRQLIGAPDEGPGLLVVTANQSGARLFIDGEPRGRVPGPPLDDLSPGRHALRVSAPGYFDWQADVYVEPGATTAQWVRLEEEPRLVKPFVAPWVYWSGWGVTAVLAGSTVLSAGVTAVFVGYYNVLRTGGVNGVVDGGALNDAYGVAAAGLWVIGLAAVATVVAGGATGLSTLVVAWEED